jgi:hypothetical protein
MVLFTDVLYFYLLFFGVLAGAAGVIAAPRLFLSVVSLFVAVSASSLLYLRLNAHYIAIFQFVFCGLVFSSLLFVLLKKTEMFNLGSKFVTKFKAFTGIVLVFVFGLLVCLFANEEFSGSLYAFFSSVSERAFADTGFSGDIFSLQLLIIMVSVAAVVLSWQREDTQ